MSVTILYKDRPPYSAAATAEGGDLWVPASDLPAASGWELRPEGACRGDVCVPIPRGREAEFLRERPARFNLAALARLLAEPVVHDDAQGVWFFGEARRSSSSFGRPGEGAASTCPCGRRFTTR